MFPYQTSSLLASAHALCGLYVDAGVHDLEVLRSCQARPGTRDHAPRELAVDSDRVGEAHAAPLEGVEGQAVELLQPPIPALDEVEVGEVAVEQDGCPRLKELQERQPRAELVDEEGIWPQGGELAVEADLDEEVQLPRDGAKDAELGEDRGWEDGVAAHANLEGSFGRCSQQLLTGESCVCWGVLDRAGFGDGARGGRDLCTVSGLVEAVFRIAMACEDDNLVAPVLQSHSGIYYQPLGTANAKIWMEKDNCLLLCRSCRLCHPALELAQFGIPVCSESHVGERTCKCIPVSALQHELATPSRTYVMAAPG